MPQPYQPKTKLVMDLKSDASSQYIMASPMHTAQVNRSDSDTNLKVPKIIQRDRSQQLETETEAPVKTLKPNMTNHNVLASKANMATNVSTTNTALPTQKNESLPHLNPTGSPPHSLQHLPSTMISDITGNLQRRFDREYMRQLTNDIQSLADKYKDCTSSPKELRDIKKTIEMTQEIFDEQKATHKKVKKFIKQNELAQDFQSLPYLMSEMVEIEQKASQADLNNICGSEVLKQMRDQNTQNSYFLARNKNKRNHKSTGEGLQEKSVKGNALSIQKGTE